jgi:hypothetical protein
VRKARDPEFGEGFGAAPRAFDILLRASRIRAHAFTVRHCE